MLSNLNGVKAYAISFRQFYTANVSKENFKNQQRFAVAKITKQVLANFFFGSYSNNFLNIYICIKLMINRLRLHLHMFSR